MLDTEAMPETKPDRIPGLDGLRALSIALVIAGHAYQGSTGISVQSAGWLILGNAGLGVEIFFVISGFLITTLLLREESKFQCINLRMFYIRRSLRIMPPLFLYIAVVGLLSALDVLGDVTWGDTLSSLLFITNYSPWAHSAALGHTWSLAVEEQFYLLWPVSLALTVRFASRKAAATLALFLITVSPFVRVMTHFSGNDFLRTHIYYMLHTRTDSLMFGCLLALTVGTDGFERAYAAVRHFVAPAAIFTLGISPLVTAWVGGAYQYVIGYTLEGASIALIMIWLTRNPMSVVGRILNSRPVVRIGVISYGLYLWQELFLKTTLPVSRCAVCGILCAILAAEVSYRVIEGPIRRSRRKYEVVKTIAKNGDGGG